MSHSNPQTKINLHHIAHVYYTHADISSANKFLLDFGFTPCKQEGNRTYYRGYGTEPFLYCAEKGDEDSFGGVAFAVESESDLQLASEMLPNASAVRRLEAPGGGKIVTFQDPTDGFPLHLVHGQASIDQLEAFPHPRVNFPHEKNRNANEFRRFEKEHESLLIGGTYVNHLKGPCPVHRLGHFGMCVTNYQKAHEFYTTFFNFKATDIIYDGSGKDITGFYHLDRGESLVDHHCFFFYEGPVSHVHHSSYEVHDFDQQVLGHDWLRDNGYENCWGVGRHVLGSQIFDYWYNPSRFIMEHYSDGDLVDCHKPTVRSKAGPNSLYIWGPDLPETFLH